MSLLRRWFPQEETWWERRLRRTWHALAGHPRDQVTWAHAIDGASCRCGAHWTIADYHI